MARRRRKSRKKARSKSYYFTRSAPRRRRPARRRTVRARPRRRRSSGMKLGSMQPLVAGLAAGALGQIASGYVGGYGHPVSAIGVGYLMKNNTLKVIGARDLGAILAGNLTGGFGSGTGGAYQS